VTVEGVLNGTIIGPFPFAFTGLTAGAPQSFAFQIVATTAGTINWTAIVTAPDDAYLPNNTVTGVTEVMAQ
jgi:hypothetical protein